MKKYPFTESQLLLLRLFYTNPEQSFYMQEIGRVIGKKPGLFQRVLNRLVEQGLLMSEYRGNARYFRANREHPLYPEIKKIIAKTVGVEGSLRDLMERLQEVKMALIYGSFAKGEERKESDIDLLIVGKPEVENRLLKVLPKLEKDLQREINYRLYSEKEYRKKCKTKDPFLEEVLTAKKILLKGDLNAI